MRQRQLKLIIEYDGTDFSGWQFQLKVRTVQGEIEAALDKIFDNKITLYGSGRTDAGVHARGQTAHIYIENLNLQCEQIRMGINSLTRRDINITEVSEIGDGFHARFDAVSRVYKYTLIKKPNPFLLRYAWYPNWDWEDQLIIEAADLLIGEHCFKALSRSRPAETEYLCHVHRAVWHINSKGAIFEIEANRYYYQMVRGIVGALMYVGRGHISVADFNELVQNPRENAQVYFAPPAGLVLDRVNY